MWIKNDLKNVINITFVIYAESLPFTLSKPYCEDIPNIGRVNMEFYTERRNIVQLVILQGKEAFQYLFYISTSILIFFYFFVKYFFLKKLSLVWPYYALYISDQR